MNHPSNRDRTHSSKSCRVGPVDRSGSRDAPLPFRSRGVCATSAKVLLPFVTLLLLSGCGGGVSNWNGTGLSSTGGSVPPASQVEFKETIPEGRYTLADHAILIKPDAGVTVGEVTESSVALSGQVPSLSPGDVLALQTGEPVLRKAVSVAPTAGGGVTVKTEPAGVNDLIKHAQLEWTGLPSGYIVVPADGVQVLNAAGRTRMVGPDGRLTVGFTVNAAKISLSATAALDDVLKGLGVTSTDLKASFEVGIPVHVRWDSEWFTLKQFYVLTGVEAEAEVGMDLTFAQPLNKSAEVTLGLVYLAPIPVGPLVLVPSGKLYAFIEFTAEAKLKVEIGMKVLDFQYLVGPEYTETSGWKLRQEPESGEESGKAWELSVTPKVEGEIALYQGVGLDMKLKLYDLAGPTVDVRVGPRSSLSAAAEVKLNEGYTELSGTWDNALRVRAKPTGEIGFWGMTLAKWDPLEFVFDWSMPGFPRSVSVYIDGGVPVVVE